MSSGIIPVLFLSSISLKCPVKWETSKLIFEGLEYLACPCAQLSRVRMVDAAAGVLKG